MLKIITKYIFVGITLTLIFFASFLFLGMILASNLLIWYNVYVGDASC